MGLALPLEPRKQNQGARYKQHSQSILKMNDAAGFKAGVVDKANATAAEMTAAGGQYVIRGEKFTSLDGTPPARLVIMKFDSLEKAEAFEKTAAQKEINAARVKTTDSLSFIVEGPAN
jgi:uncharacterized protein (DUF1330 family)